MKKFKKVLSTLLVGVISVTSLVFGSVSTSAASAKDIVAKALKEMQNSTSISFSYEYISNFSDGQTRKQTGAFISDSKIDYGIVLSASEVEKAWTHYAYKGKIYRKAYNSNSFTAYTNSDYIEEQGTSKKELEYNLAHLKDVKISGTTDNYYTISAKPNWKDSGLKTIYLTINKKTNHLVKYVGKFAKKTYTYIDSKQKYTITGGSKTCSNICYGDMALSLPDELKGK